MRWKQFLTPVKSFDASGAEKLLSELPAEGVNIMEQETS